MKGFTLHLPLLIALISPSITLNVTVDHQPNTLGEASAIFVDKTYIPNLSHITIIKSISPENSQAFTDTFTSFIASFSSEFTFQLEEATALRPILDRRRSNIFFVDSLASFEAICAHLNHETFKMRKLFTVISINQLCESEMRRIFDCFFDRLVIDANIVAHDANGSVNMFTFFPYRGEAECGKTDPIKINSFDSSRARWSKEKFFYRRSNNLRGCPLRIGAAAVAAEPAVMMTKGSNGTAELAGIEKDLFIEFAHRLNFTAEFVIYNDSVGSIYANGSSRGVLAKVLGHQVDCAIGFVSLQYERTIFLSETKAYAMHSLAMLIPKGEEYGDMEKLLRPFSKFVWIALLSIFFVSSLLALTFTHFPVVYNFVMGRQVKHPLSNIIAIHLGVSQPRLPMRNFSRFILLNFLAYCLVVRSSYQGAVYNILMSNERKPPVSSIAEMMDRGFTFYMYESLANRLQGFAFYRNRKVFPNGEIDNYRRRTLSDNFKGVVFNYENQIHYLNQLNFKNYTYTICKEHFLTPSFVFYFRKNHFIVSEVNAYIDRMLANGLIDSISSQYADKGYLKLKPDEAPKVLEIRHIYGAIEVYFLCNCLSAVVFIMELATRLRPLRRFQPIRRQHFHC